MNLELADVRRHWDHLAVELIRLHIKDSRRGVADWIPEDVYAACLYGYAKLYTCKDGYMVFKMKGDEFIVWFVLSTTPGQSLLEEYFGEVCDIAEEAAAKTMSFITTRKGYDRVIDRGCLPGFRLDSIKYVREV